MKNRMVCECYGITTEHIKQALISGARGYEDLVQSMRLGVMCSACVDDAKRVVAELQKEIKGDER